MGERRDFDEEDGPCPTPWRGLLVPEEISRKRLDDERDRLLNSSNAPTIGLPARGNPLPIVSRCCYRQPSNHCDARLNYEAGQINRDGRNLREVCLKAHAIRSVAANLKPSGAGRCHWWRTPGSRFYAYPRYPNHGARGEDRCPHGRAESTKPTR